MLFSLRLSSPGAAPPWDLDVGEAQSLLYINGLAVPMEDFTLSGSQTLRKLG